jgi:hypothetical protein
VARPTSTNDIDARGFDCGNGSDIARERPAMKTRIKLLGLGIVVLALGLAGYALTASSEEAGPGFDPPFMHDTN